jgi:hypothetical protein
MIGYGKQAEREYNPFFETGLKREERIWVF